MSDRPTLLSNNPTSARFFEFTAAIAESAADGDRFACLPL
jgi:hypothetical protein